MKSILKIIIHVLKLQQKNVECFTSNAESNGKLPHYLSLVKLQPWFLSLQWKTYLWIELQPWFLRLQ